MGGGEESYLGIQSPTVARLHGLDPVFKVNQEVLGSWDPRITPIAERTASLHLSV